MKMTWLFLPTLTHTLSLSHTHTHTFFMYTHTHYLSVSYVHTHILSWRHTYKHTFLLSRSHECTNSGKHTHTHTHTHTLSPRFFFQHAMKRKRSKEKAQFEQWWCERNTKWVFLPSQTFRRQRGCRIIVFQCFYFNCHLLSLAKIIGEIW